MSDMDVGQIVIRYEEPLIAGRLVTVEFEYTVGGGGLAENGRLRIGLPNVAWAKPEVPQYYFWSEYAKGKQRRYTDYDRVNTTVRFETKTEALGVLDTEPRFRKPWTFPPSWLRDYDRNWITVTVEDADLEAGDKILVTYGDPHQLPLTARVQRYPEKKLCFLAFVDVGDGGGFAEVAGSPLLTTVEAGEASRLDVIAPSIVRPTDVAKLRVAYTDEVKAPPRTDVPIESLELTVDDETDMQQVGQCSSFVQPEAPQLRGERGADEAVRIQVRDRKHRFESVGNPALLRDNGPRLFFGDLHGQSQYHSWNPIEKVGISCGTPEECLRYARDIAGLDFCAITDTASITKEIWRDVVDTAQRMNEPGKFVAFQGSEVGDNVNGHRNLVFSSDQPQPGIEAKKASGGGDLLVDLQTPRMHDRYAGRDDVILIPHHTKMWLTWDCHDPTLEPVMEIHSIWGSGEKAGTDNWAILREMTGGAQEAWARGHRLGVIGGSDTHAGLPGRCLAESDRDDFMPYTAGYAAVWADELTRSGVFKAIKQRRCYATTGVRIILETFIGDSPMGSEIAWPDPSKPRDLRVNVWGQDELDSVTVVKNNQDIATFNVRAADGQLTWRDEAPAGDGDYYYVRVIQRDGHRAWSSPIWLNIGTA